MFLDAYARGGSGGVGVFVNGGFVDLSGEQCNEMFPELSSGVLMHRTLGGGQTALPSTAANHWELFAFIVLLRLFPEVISNRYIGVRSDSVAACTCVQSLHAGVDCVELAHLTRAVLSECVHLNCRLSTVHIAGVANVLADPLSRDKWSEFGIEASTWVSHRHGVPSAFLVSL